MAKVTHNPQTKLCPAAALADEAQEYIDLVDALDEVEFTPPNGFTREEIEKIKVVVDQHLDSVAERASYVRCTSARGALFQLCIAHHFVENRDISIARKLMVSVASYIEDNTVNAIRENACSDYFMNRKFSDQYKIERALAIKDFVKVSMSK